MGVIANVINSTETIMTAFPEMVYNAVGPSLIVALKAAGAIALAGVAVNQMLQIRQINYMEYIIWFIRYGCILAIATIWANFQPFYNLIVDVPNNYASALIGQVETTQRVWKDRDEAACGRQYNTGPFGLIVWSSDPASCWVDEKVTVAITTGSAGTYDLLDTFKDRIFSIAGDVIGQFRFLDGGTWKYIFGALIIYIIGIVFTAFAIVTALTAKVGLAVSMGLAPLAIAMLTFNQTRGYFEKWLRLTVGFAIVPLMIVAVMSVIVTVGNGLPQGDDFFGGYMAFILVAIAGLVFMSQIPAMSSSLADINLPQIGAAAASRAVSSMSGFVRSPLTFADAIGNRASAGINQWKIAKASGGGNIAAAYKGLTSMSQSAQFRRDKRDRFAYQADALEIAKFDNKNRSGKNAPETDKPSDSKDKYFQDYERMRIFESGNKRK